MLNLFKHMLISLYIHLTLLYVDFYSFLLYDVALFLCLCVFQLFLLVLLGIALQKILYSVFYSLQFSFDIFANLVFCFTFLFFFYYFLCFSKLILFYFDFIFFSVVQLLFQKLNLCSPIKVWVFLFVLFVCCFSYVCSLFFHWSWNNT